MKTSLKIITAVLIIIIIAAIGAAIYVSQNNHTNNKPSPTPTPTPTVDATVTTTNQTVTIGLGGNVTKSELSNLAITPSQSAGTTIIKFNITGTTGTTGFSNMTIQKTAIAYGTSPTVLIDGQTAADQGYTQNTSNYYVWYTTHFSSHEVQITFVASTQSPTPTSTSTHTPQPTFTSAPTLAPGIPLTPTPSPTTLTVATTSSLHDSGLEDNGINGNTTGTLKSAFQTVYPWITVNFVAASTGQAIAKAQAGDADMILVHSPSQELTFMANNYGVDRKIIAYNFFVIVGPANDPAGITGMSNVSQALKQLYTAAQTNSQVVWVTRNDGSGTTTAETTLWKNAGYTYSNLLTNTSWFKSTGQGMGPSLLVANQLNAYILSDTGTYIAYYDSNSIQLKIEIQGQQALLNVYSAIIDNPQNITTSNFAASLTFVNWLVSNSGQQVIGSFGQAVYGQQLFASFVPLVSGASPNATLLNWIQSYAYMSYNTATNAPVINASGTECPAQYRYNAGNLYSPSYDNVANMNLSMSITAPNYVTNSQQPITNQPSPSLNNRKFNKE